MSKLSEYQEKLEQARKELTSAGPVHAKDLRRQIHRMEKEIMIYKKYQRQEREWGKDANIQS